MVTARILFVCIIVVMASISAAVGVSAAGDSVRINRVFIDTDSTSMMLFASLEPSKSFSNSRVEVSIPESGEIGSVGVDLSAGETKSVRIIVPVHDLFEYIKVVFIGNNQRTVKYVPVQ